MTDEEMVAEGERVLLQYARNEKRIVCLSGRLSEISKALGKFADASQGNQANGDRQTVLYALGERDLRADVNQLADAIAEREDLKSKMTAHGYAHMIR